MLGNVCAIPGRQHDPTDPEGTQPAHRLPSVLSEPVLQLDDAGNPALDGHRHAEQARLVAGHDLAWLDARGP